MFSVGIQSLIGLLIISAGAQAAGPAAINLGSAGNFTILAKTGVSTVPQSAIIGNVGVSPASSTSLTGFSIVKSVSGTTAGSTQVVGSLLAADFTSPTPEQLTTAVSDMQTAFSDGNSRLLPTSLNLLGGLLTSQTLTPGLYKWTSGVTVTTSLTLAGLSTDVWIFQIAGNLVFAPGAQTILAGASASNVFWVVSGSVALQAASLVNGVILGGTKVALTTGASVNGHIFAQSAVTLQKSTVKPS